MNTLQAYHVSVKEHDNAYIESSLYINAYTKAEVEDYLTQLNRSGEHLLTPTGHVSQELNLDAFATLVNGEVIRARELTDFLRRHQHHIKTKETLLKLHKVWSEDDAIKEWHNQIEQFERYLERTPDLKSDVPMQS